MKTYYNCKLRYTKQHEDGSIKHVKEDFLLDGVSYTEAETLFHKFIEENISGEFTVKNIYKTNISEVINYEDSDNWYKCKVLYVTIDGDSSKEVKVSKYFLVNAKTVKEAYERIEDSLSSMLVPFEIPSITLTNVVEVIEYKEKS